MSDERQFLEFRCDVSARTLVRLTAEGEQTIALGARAFDLLRLFLDRPCALVTKEEIFAAVWPGMAVEESNLTVQMSALRRTLDSGRAGPSCIRTIPGRGYQLNADVQALAPSPGTEAEAPEPSPDPVPGPAPARQRRLWAAGAITGGVAVIAAIGFAAFERKPPAPPLSVALQVETSDGGAGQPGAGQAPASEFLAALGADLAQVPHAVVKRARAADGQRLAAVGRRDGVRYVLEASAAPGKRFRVVLQLIDVEGEATVWSGTYEASDSNDVVEVAAEAARAASAGLIQAEARRLERLPANGLSPDELVILATAIYQAPGPVAAGSAERAAGFLARAAALDPSRLDAVLPLAFETLRPVLRFGGTPDREARIARAAQLEELGRSVRPGDPHIQALHAVLLVQRGRCGEAEPLLRRLLDGADPANGSLYAHQLGMCLRLTGRYAEAIDTLRTALSAGDWNAGGLKAQLGLADYLAGDARGAVAAFREAALLSSGDTLALDLFEIAAQVANGDLEEARLRRDDLLARHPDATLAWIARQSFSGEGPDVRSRLQADLTLIGWP